MVICVYRVTPIYSSETLYSLKRIVMEIVLYRYSVLKWDDRSSVRLTGVQHHPSAAMSTPTTLTNVTQWHLPTRQHHTQGHPPGLRSHGKEEIQKPTELHVKIHQLTIEDYPSSNLSCSWQFVREKIYNDVMGDVTEHRFKDTFTQVYLFISG